MAALPGREGGGAHHDGDAAGRLVEPGPLVPLGEKPVDFRGRPGDHHVLTPRHDPIDDGHHLLGGLARAEDRLGEAAAQSAVVVDLGEAQVFEGQGLQALARLVGGQGTLPYGVQQVFEGAGIH